jgi:hypothetical protein
VVVCLHRARAWPLPKHCAIPTARMPWVGHETFAVAPEQPIEPRAAASESAGTPCSCSIAAPCREATHRGSTSSPQQLHLPDQSEPTFRNGCCCSVARSTSDVRAGKVIWSWIAVVSTRRRRRKLQMVRLRWYAYDHRLTTHAGHRRPSPGTHGGIGFHRLERCSARQTGGFAMKLASVPS